MDVSAAVGQRVERVGATGPALAERAESLLDLIARDPNFDRDRALNALLTVRTRTTWP